MLHQVACERWSSPGAHPGWELWHDRERAEGWVTEGALGFASAVDVTAVLDLFGEVWLVGSLHTYPGCLERSGWLVLIFDWLLLRHIFIFSLIGEV